MPDETDDAPNTPDAGEVEWAGTIVKKPPHAEENDAPAADPESDPLDEAERLGDDHYPA